MEYARLNTEAEASKCYGVPRSTIYYWKDIDKVPKEKFKKLAKKMKGKHLKSGSGRPVSYPSELDDEVLSWVLKQRDLHLPVTRQDIQLMAKKNSLSNTPIIQSFIRLGKQVYETSFSVQ